MGNKWTTEQQEAIRTIGGNILVSAAAGAGKTAVLVARLVQRIIDPKDPLSVDKVLVVTFTNAAAQEMKDRIGQALDKEAEADLANTYLTEQRLLLNKAAISTLHSFCLDLIRQNYYLLELPEALALDPGFRVGDETETSLLRLEVLDELFEEKYTAEEPLFLQLVECVGGQKDDLGLQKIILKLYDFARSQRNPERWLTAVARKFSEITEPGQADLYYDYLVAYLQGQLTEALINLQRAEELAAMPGGPQVYIQIIQEEIAGLTEIIALGKKGWAAMTVPLEDFEFSRLKSCKSDVEQALKEGVQSLRNKAKKIVNELKTKYLSSQPEVMLQDMQEMAPLMEYLCQLVLEYDRLYLTAKLAKNVIDFGDIEHLALKLLTEEREGKYRSSPLAEKIQQQYLEVLVDEYQDINGVQEAILEAVSGNLGDAEAVEGAANMFMVGDVKQSIYGFRLADSRLFLSKYHQYPRHIPGVESLERKILLTKNFRSRNNILQGINFIFRQLMTEKLGGLIYDEQAELVCGTDYPPAEDPEAKSLANFPIELTIIDRHNQPEEQSYPQEEAQAKGFAGEENTDEEPVGIQLEAKLAAQRIEEIKGTLVWDKGSGKYRPATYRDMVVILRSPKGMAEVFLEEFRRAGIPAYAEISGGYLSAQEIMLMLSVLQIVDNPRQDLPLVAVLRSNMVGLSSSELARIRIHMPKGDFYDALCLVGEKDEGELGGKTRQFLTHLQFWRNYARQHTLSDLIRLIYRQTGYYTYVGALPGGAQRQANLRALQDRARQFEKTTLRGLFNFLRFLEQLEERQGDLGVARALGEKEDVVRIMSIHKSKGLEFPIVILAGLGKEFNQQDLRADLLIDKDLGLGPYRILAQERLKYPTLAQLAIKEKLRQDNLAEELRILYVAMTRAREALILLGTVKNLSARLEDWELALRHPEWELPFGLQNKAKSYMDWLIPALLRHQEGRNLLDLGSVTPIPLEDLKASSWYNDSSAWKIRIVQEGFSVSSDDEQEENQYAPLLEQVKGLEPIEDTVDKEEIENRLSWQYPDLQLANIPAKASVSELKNRYRQMLHDVTSEEIYRHREYNRRPVFRREQKGLSPGEKGTALHMVMRYLNLEKVNNIPEIEAQLEEMVSQQKITIQQKEVLNAQLILDFFRQPIGQRLLSSKEVRREVPFTLALSPKELFAYISEDVQEKIILQGTLDCLFAEDEGYILLDYKSDYIPPNGVEDFIERYRLQLNLYARAVETILKVPVKEKILYSFNLTEAFTLSD